MTMPDEPWENAVDDLLRVGNVAESDDARKMAVLGQTVGVIRRRRRLKRLGIAAALAVCYLAGIVTPVSRFLNRPEQSNQQLATNRNPELNKDTNWNWNKVAVDGQQAAVAETAKTREDAFVPVDNWNTSANSTVKKITQYERMRREGDRLLQESGDIAQAVRRYNRALALATETELAVATDKDNWLLMALKNERTKEISNDRSPLN
jgi:hypothetical protein